MTGTREQVHRAFRLAVRDGLERTGLTQKAVAAAVEKSPVDISRYLSDPKRLPREWQLVDRILRAAGADAAAFARVHGSFWGLAAGDGASHLDLVAPETGTQQDSTEQDGEGREDGEVQHESAEDGEVQPLDAESGEDVPEPGASPFDELWDQDPPLQDTSVTTAEASVPGEAGSNGRFRSVASKLRGIEVTPARTAIAGLLVLALALGVAVAVLAHKVSGLDGQTSSDSAPAAPLATWTATVDTVTSPGLALRTGPSRSSSRVVAQLAAGSSLAVECGQVGEVVTSPTGKTARTWLRTPANLFVTDLYVQVAGPVAIPNCIAGQPPLTLPS